MLSHASRDVVKGALLDDSALSLRADRQVWLCVLAQRAGQRDPAIRYREVGGAIFQRFEHPDALPALWPAQAPWPPELGVQTTNDGRLRARAVCASFTVDVEADGPPPERLDPVAVEAQAQK